MMYELFDIAKFILSFLVACIHVDAFISINSDLNFYFNNTIARLAVPLFFTISGFLIFKKLNSKNEENEKKEIIIKYLKRIIIMYTIWSLIYFVPYIVNNGGIDRIFKFFLHFLIDGVYDQLWYLQSLIVGAFITFISVHFFGTKKTLIISIIFYFIGLILVPYYPLFQNILEKTPIISTLINVIHIALKGKRIGRNGITFGMFFFTLGAYFAEKKYKYNKHKNIVFIICSLLLLLIESMLIRKIGGTYFALQISLVFCTISIFSFLLNNTKKYKFKTVLLRKLSILIYLIHPWIIFIYNCICKYIYSKFLWNNSILKYGFVMSITLAISYLIVKLSEKDKYKFLKYLY